MARTPATSRRAAPTKVGKPFPWGTVLGSVVLGILLVGLVAYAALNQGSGVSELVRDPDSAIEGLQVADAESLSRNHVPGPVEYEQLPPPAGDHNAVPQQCAVYDEPIAPEHAVHSLEHGAVWITYNDDLPAEEVEELADKVDGAPYGLMSPLPEQDSALVLTAWGRTLELDSADDDRVDDFIEAYASGPQTPERGAACIGNTTTGPLAGAPAAEAPAAEAPAAEAPAGEAPAGEAPAAEAPPAEQPAEPAPATSPGAG